MTRVSIKSIAESLNVSAMTVSLVLNNKAQGRVSQTVIDKVKNYAEKVHYQPNFLARSLKDGKSRIIGLVVADISNAFFSQIALYIQQCAETYGYNVLIANTNESDSQFTQVVSLLQSHQVDGFIIVPTTNSINILCELREQGVPFVLMDRYFENMNASYVVSDNYEASMQAVLGLLNQGVQNLVMINYATPMINLRMREQAYVETMQKAGCVSKVITINPNNFNTDMQRAIRTLIKSDQSVDAIYFATNTLTMEGIRCLKKYAKRPLSSYKILSFDKTEAFDLMDMRVAYIQQPVHHMSRVAVEILLKLLKGEQKDERVILKSQVVLP